MKDITTEVYTMMVDKKQYELLTSETLLSVPLNKLLSHDNRGTC